LQISKLIFKIIIKISLFLNNLKEDFLEHNGYKIAYLKSRKFKNSDTIIFIHGLNDQKETWLELIKKLKGKNIIAIDLLGSGNSDKVLDFDYSIYNQANFLEEVIKKIALQNGINSYSLAGHSMGGGIALILANRLNLNNLYLFAPYGLDIKESRIKKRAIKNHLGKNIWKNICTIDKLKEVLADLYYKVPNFPNFVLELLVAKKCKYQKLESIKIDALVDDNLNIKDNLEKEALKVSTNCYIFWGKEDFVIDVASAYKYNELIKNSKLFIYEKCGHMVHIERAKEVAKELQNS